MFFCRQLHVLLLSMVAAAAAAVLSLNPLMSGRPRNRLVGMNL